LIGGDAMGLKEYRKKRTFTKTPEPEPAKTPKANGAKSAGLAFVVHKHQATHLHYDLRLEHAGVLKSWAVPKGPSMDPRDKRLAIMVEDHPLAYKDFAGRIPEGEYGAGLVEIWDHGTYAVGGEGLGRKDQEKLVEASLKKGHLDLRFSGRKLRGLFTLVHIRPRDGGKDNQWLLMKRHEPDSTSGSERHAKGPAKGDDPPGRTASLADLDLEGAAHGPFPGEVDPMLATLVEAPFDRQGWSFEVKWDGFRSIAEVKGGKVKLLSRNAKSQNTRFPAVAEALAGLAVDAVLDGEIVSVDEKGRPDFQALQNSMRTGEGRILYYVFDLLQVDGRDLRPLPLRRRQAILSKILPASKVVRLSEPIEAKGEAFFRAAEKNGLEGIMAKDMDSPYRPGRRTRDWLKIKSQKRQEAVIAGFTKPRASRRYFGALILGAYKNGRLTYIGHVGTGFTERSLKDLFGKLRPLVTETSPFAEAPKTNMPVAWVRPKLVGEVKFSEWTSDGLMRQPVFLGLRDDKSAREVVREKAAATAAVLDPPRLRTRAELTHLEKVFWPGEGYTKGDVVEYYAKMSGRLLPYLQDRPQALNRHPDGIAGESFFQKNITQEPPEWVKTVTVRSEDVGKDIRYLVCQNRDTLIYEANLGAIELNVWSSSLPHLDRPDYVVFDFDPLETSFPSVVEAVLATKKFLDELRIPAFCKTSGATGLHVYVPLEPRFTFEEAQQLAHLVLLFVNRRNPGLTSLERTPSKRRGRIYLDYLQNRKGATMAAPFSLRPREGAPVSMPLDWKDVTARLDPLEFNIRTVPKIVERKGDAWKDLFKKRLDLNAALGRFERWQKGRRAK
jgi:bifunctional non-homologous end joining protein LigD